MRKLLYLFACLCMLFLVSCTTNELSIIGLDQNDDGYHLYTDNSTFLIKDYINATGEYTVTYKGFVYSSARELKFELQNGENIFVVSNNIVSYNIYVMCNVKYIILVDSVEYIYNEGDIINIDEPIKEGYKFVGWQTESIIIQNGTKYDPSFGTVFTSVYEKNEYKLIYNVDGLRKEVYYKFGDKIEQYVPEKEGYEFIGWMLNNVITTIDCYDYLTDIELVASFKPLEFIITYNDDGIISNQIVKYNEDYTLLIPTKDGYKFIGWMNNDNLFENGKWIYLNNITLISKWEKVVQQIKLNLETFGANVSEHTIVGDDGFIILPIPEKDGFIFNGWYYDSKLTNRVQNLLPSSYNNEVLYASYQFDSDLLKGQLVATKLNSHATNYDELALFDSNQSGFTSKYWYKVGIKKSDKGYFVSAIAKSGDSLSSLGDYDYVLLAYANYYKYQEFINLNINIGDDVVFSSDLTLLDNGDNTIIVGFFEKDIQDDLMDIKEYLENNYQNLGDVNTDIDLITNYNGYQITWKTSNKNAITTSGKYLKPYTDRIVTLSAYCGNTLIHSFDVKVIGEKQTSEALSTGYIYTPYKTITQNAMNTLDIIYCAFLEIDENANWTNLSRMTSNINEYIMPKAKISGTKVVISVNQSSSGCFSNVASSDELRKKLASNIVIFIKDLGLDGIDIDWETPSQAEAENFTLLMKEIYEQVKKENSEYLVTAAIGGGKWAPPKYDLPHSKEYIDYINLMTYSMASGSGYYQNALYKSSKGATLVSCSIEESIEIYNDLGVENSKILVGIPFYTTVQTESGGPGSKTGSGKSVWYSYLYSTYQLSDTMKEYFDYECGVPYRYDEVNKIFISFDNEESIKIKCDYINTLGLAGIMYWQYGQDVDDVLSNAINKYINE